MTDTPANRCDPIFRLPAFAPVPLRARKDGWTPLRQAEFLGVLAETRSVTAAASFVGISRESAYRLRRRSGAGEFAAVWDGILEPVRARTPKVTLEPVFRRILQDRYRPVLRGGKYVGTIKKPDNAALLSGLAQLDRADLAWCNDPATAKGHGKEKGASV